MRIVWPLNSIKVETRPLRLSLHDRIEANKSEARTLAQYRDLLLPKLMSGELFIANAEKYLASAV